MAINTSALPETNRGTSGEKWKPIPRYEGLYEISNFGNIIGWINNKGNRRAIPKLLSPGTRRKGYKGVVLCKNSVRTAYLVHRLVMATFIGPCPEGMQVNHKDGNTANNRLNNLEYLTPKENMQHSYRELGRKAPKGAQSGNSKLSERQVVAIKREYEAGNVSTLALSRKYGVGWTTVKLITSVKPGVTSNEDCYAGLAERNQSTA